MIHGNRKDLHKILHLIHFIKPILLEDYQNLKDFKILILILELVLEALLDLRNDLF
jgi:hypothetical protein